MGMRRAMMFGSLDLSRTAAETVSMSMPVPHHMGTNAMPVVEMALTSAGSGAGD
jgi:hypothetical protein